MTDLYIRIEGMGPGRRYVEIENGDGESVDIVSDAIADGDYTLLELDVTPNDELRELIEEWRYTADHRDESENHVRAQALRRCAGELDKVVDND